MFSLFQFTGILSRTLPGDNPGSAGIRKQDQSVKKVFDLIKKLEVSLFYVMM